MKGNELLDLLREHTGNRDQSGYDEINDAYETILRRAGMWITRVRDETSLEFRDGDVFYSLPMERIRRLESIWIKDNEDFKEWRQLEEVTEDKFEQVVFQYRKEDSTDDKDVPRYYRLAMGDTHHLEVTPTPDGTYPARLVYIGNPEEIGAFTTPVLPGNYHRTIAKLAAAFWLEINGGEKLASRAHNLRKQAEDAYFPLAVDISVNRAGVARPKQRIMRT